jgi:hypothetical protein
MADAAFSEELQIAVMALSERMIDFMSWAEQMQADFRLLQRRMDVIEQRVAGAWGGGEDDDDEIDRRLAALRA